MSIETIEAVQLNRLTHEIATGVAKMIHMFGDSWMRLYLNHKVVTYGEGITSGVDL